MSGARLSNLAPELNVGRLAKAIEAACPLPLGWMVDGPAARRRVAFAAQARSIAAEYAALATAGADRCTGCGGAHPFDTSVPSPLWNRVIRDGGLTDYLCTTCIVLAFVKAGESFDAKLYGDAFDGVAIHVEIPAASNPTAPHVAELAPQTWDEADDMCPNCVTPWKCNGPHLSDETVAGRWHAAHPGADR